MMIEGPRFRLWLEPNLSAEEYQQAASAICRILADPPQSPKRRRAVAVRQALNLYSGARSNRAKQLASRYRLYLAGAWPREQALEVLPEPRSTERVLLHRLARCNAGASLSWRRIFDIATFPHE
jgi:hypothetical protein